MMTETPDPRLSGQWRHFDLTIHAPWRFDNGVTYSNVGDYSQLLVVEIDKIVTGINGSGWAELQVIGIDDAVAHLVEQELVAQGIRYIDGEADEVGPSEYLTIKFRMSGRINMAIDPTQARRYINSLTELSMYLHLETNDGWRLNEPTDPPVIGY